MYRQAGGEDLVRRVMEEKKAAGSTLMTTVHHRETPARLLAGEADTGPVWATEAAFARAQDLPLESVEPGEALDQRDKVNYYACRLDKGPNPKNADKFLEFLRGKEAKRIYASYGFTPA
jgi:ABC-type molybdate transport system substrate-binding protein